MLVCRAAFASDIRAAFAFGVAEGGSLNLLSNLGNQADEQGDRHFSLVLGLPYTITIKIPCILLTIKAMVKSALVWSLFINVIIPKVDNF